MPNREAQAGAEQNKGQLLTSDRRQQKPGDHNDKSTLAAEAEQVETEQTGQSNGAGSAEASCMNTFSCPPDWR
jgi:hypothetical protein